MSGPRRLGSLLAGWNERGRLGRKAANVDEAASALASVWETAVGRDISRRSRPAKLSGGILTVLTASSAWSDELSFLAPKILAALRQAVPEANLKRLRFMVASGRTRLLLEGVRLQSEAMRDRAAGEPSSIPAAPQAHSQEDVHATVARLAELQRSLDEARDRAGWRRCTGCGLRFAPKAGSAAQCAPCAQAALKRRQAKIERALMQAPWLSARELRESFPEVKATAYERSRQRLLTRWQFEIESAARRLRRGTTTPEDRVAAWSYLMLLTGLPERDIGPAVVAETLGQAWVSALFDDRRVAREARRAPREKYR